MISKSSMLRIIGGRWRGRKIRFDEQPGLRPTPDRIRETLFNWLAPHIRGARCLDLFTGSGALGLEALSRGAAEVVFIDQSAEVVSRLLAIVDDLSIDNAQILQGQIPSLEFTQPAFDIIFLDPPFHENLLASSYIWLNHNRLLKENSLIYIEAEKELSDLGLADNWQLLKSKQAGQLQYHLARIV